MSHAEATSWSSEYPGAKRAVAGAVVLLAAGGLLADCGPGNSGGGGTGPTKGRFGNLIPDPRVVYSFVGEAQPNVAVAQMEQPQMHAASFDLQGLGLVQANLE